MLMKFELNYQIQRVFKDRSDCVLQWGLAIYHPIPNREEVTSVDSARARNDLSLEQKH